LLANNGAYHETVDQHETGCQNVSLLGLFCHVLLRDQLYSTTLIKMVEGSIDSICQYLPQVYNNIHFIFV